MKLELVFCLALVLVGLSEGSDVIELDESNFDTKVVADLMLVEFYAPWCGHCKRLAPEYEKAATRLVKEGIPLAKVDCPANNALCSRFGVTGYPTLKIFRDGQVNADYQGPRDENGIVSYMKKQNRPSSVELSSVEQFKDFIENEEPSVIGFFKSDSSLKEAFMSVSNTLREDFRFGYSTEEEVLEEYGYEDNVVIFQPPFMVTKLEKSPFEYTGAAQANKLKTFIKQNFMGITGVRTVDNQKYFEEKRPLCVVYYDIDYALNPKGTNYWRNRVIKVAKEFQGSVNFAVSDGDDFFPELQAFGFDAATNQPIAGIYDAKGKYAMDKTEKFSVDALKSFVQAYLDDELENFVKSEPVPEPNDDPVTVVVGKNFDRIVNDESKDVLIEFYAPWCGHCKALAPKFDELGELLKDDPNIVIAKTDATANDYPPGFEVRGYPTLYWVPAGDKSNPRKYEGGREVNDFVKYIKENAKNPPIIAKKGKGKSEL